MPRNQHMQNRIDYIVLGNPIKARKLLVEKGFIRPNTKTKIIPAVKNYVKLYGSEAIKELIALHPDRALILSLNKDVRLCNSCKHKLKDSEESNYCGACSASSNYLNYSPKNAPAKDLSGLSVESLQSLYHNAIEESKKNPNDIEFSDHVQKIWHQLKTKIKEESSPDQLPKMSKFKAFVLSDEAQFMGISIALGAILVLSIKGKSK